jgi:hypothetical protein
MTPDYQALLFNPIYSELSVPATLLLTWGSSKTLAVIDHTTGVALTDRMSVESIRPVVRVRGTELNANGIDVADLPGNQISLNGQCWRIKATRTMPAPTGELVGEVMLILLSEGDDRSA